MKRSLTAYVTLLVLMTVSAAFAQQFGLDGLDEAMVRYTLGHVQQEGSFYFLPFQTEKPCCNADEMNAPPASVNPIINPESALNGSLAGRIQFILRVLAKFEKERGVEVVHFELIRDANNARAGYSQPLMPSYSYGLLVKAVPKK